ncbi:PhzF family phenazine biosynthesis protein [Homoserinibacter sp. YIM 151385]|uniref:PhzF family phenazine biosynthesis protein n=1 Tax=Homoserinibacter sp. YIM 151385 TaxID=2985506 RepID=UPI0022F05EEE|nr:PhzF family phenazine biosynthesis isomerase [Homoserinibacter sp. YIM 151385]WBU38207.1 PhzF family phenazine biosynthesis isomerase [Homoserinibacter sp. YIM 151385]
MEILELAAFTTDPAGGNPAGVVIDADELDEAEMLAIAARLGHSETAFVSRRTPGRVAVRYFSPLVEIPFCGHATIATGVALAGRGAERTIVLETGIGEVRVDTARTEGGATATLTSVEPAVHPLDGPLLDELLGILGIPAEALDPRLPPVVADAGNRQPVLAVGRDAFEALAYDMPALAALMAREGFPATVAVIHLAEPGLVLARNPFPPGGIREDPATGSAAAAVGAALRDAGLLALPARIRIRQGGHVGRPSELLVDVPVAGGIRVTGVAVPLRASAARPEHGAGGDSAP